MRRNLGSRVGLLLLLSWLGVQPARAMVCNGMDGGPGDLDGDGFVAAADCDDKDPGRHAVPSAVSNMRVPGADNRHVFTWDAADDLGGDAVTITYDVLRSSVRSNFLDHPSVTCIEPSGIDRQATDPTVPSPGVVFYYIAAARNECGRGSLGTTGAGLERAGRDCDCAVLCNDGNSCTKDTCSNGTCAHAAVPPELLLDPAGTAVCSGQAARFEVVARGSGTLSYQWRMVGLPVGANSPVLVLPAVTPADNGAAITVEVTDSCTSATSGTGGTLDPGDDPAVLTVFADATACAGGVNGQEPPNLADPWLVPDIAGDYVVSPVVKDSTGRIRDRPLENGVRLPTETDISLPLVQLHSGEFQLSETDMVIAGRGLDVVWTRDYISREWRSTAQGVGWTSSYDRRVELDPSHPGSILVYDGESRIDSYAPNLLGCWEALGFFRELCSTPGGGYVLTFADKTTWSFAPLDGSPAAGRITEVKDASNNTLGFAYDGSGRLVTITDALARDIQVAYNARNLVSTVTDFLGRQWRYAYYDGVEPGGSLDDLKSVTSPAVVGTVTGNDFADGTTTTYTYTTGSPIGQLNHNLLTITNPEGVTWLRNVYTSTENPADPRFDRVDRQLLIEGTATYVYAALSPGEEPGAVSKTVFKSPLGDVSTHYFDAQGRLVFLRERTGRTPQVDLPTDGTQNAPVAQLRSSDPAAFDTRYAYNADSLLTQVIHPAGSSVELSYDAANPSPRKRGDLVERVTLPGPLGGDQSEIVETWTHGIDFGTDWDDVPGQRKIYKTYLPSMPSRWTFGGAAAGSPAKTYLPTMASRWTFGQAAGQPAYKTYLPTMASRWTFGGPAAGSPAKTYLPTMASRWTFGQAAGQPAYKTYLPTMASRWTFGQAAGQPAYKTYLPTMASRWTFGQAAGQPAYKTYLPTMANRWTFGQAAGQPAYKTYLPTMASRWTFGVPAGQPAKTYLPSMPSRWTFGSAAGRDWHACGGGCASDDSPASCGSERTVGAGQVTEILARARDGIREMTSSIAEGRSFPTSYTDGRGNTWSMVYDSTGDLTDLTAPAVVTGVPGGSVQTIHHEWSYNAAGQVTQYTSPEGRVDQYHYYTSGPATGYPQDVVVDAAGAVLLTVTARDAVGNVTRVTEPGGATTDFTLNAHDDVVRVTSSPPFSYQTYLYYDAVGRHTRTDVQNVDDLGVVAPNPYLTTMVEIKENDHVVFEMQETAPGQCVREELHWDANGNPSLWRSGSATSGHQPTNVVRMLPDERGLRYRVIDAEGDPAEVTVQWNYDLDGNTAEVLEGLEDPLGPRVTVFAHDGYDRPVLVTDAEGNTSSLHYDPNDNVVSVAVEGELIEGVSGASVPLFQADYVHDEANRPVVANVQHFDQATGVAIGDGVSTSRTFYDADSRVVRNEDDNGHGTDVAYDSAGRVATVHDPAGNTRSYMYDPRSDVHEITDVEVSDLPTPPETLVTHLEHDALHRPTAVVDDLGNRWEQAYDSRDDVTRATDSRGNVSRFEVDGAGRPVRAESDLTDTGTGSGTVTDTVVRTWVYDDSSRLVSSTDPNGNPTSYGYDVFDEMVLQTSPDGTQHHFVWDYHGDLTQLTDANGTVQTMTYDRLGRLVSRSLMLAPGVVGTTSETYRYNGRCLVAVAQDDDTLVTRAYDSLCNMTAESLQIAGEPARTMTVTHDGVGNPLEVTRPAGHVVAIGHDFVDRVKTLAVDGSPIASYDYVGPQRTARLIRSGSCTSCQFGLLLRVTQANGVTSSYSYDGARRRVEESHLLGPGATIGQTHTWDAAYNRTSRTALAPGTASHTYTYDSISRLVGSTETLPGSPLVAVSYALDDAGNRLSVTGGQEAGPYTMSPALPEPADQQMNQYTTTPAGSRQYSPSGATLVLDGGTAQERTLATDYRNQTVQISSALGTTSYRYDGLGRRVERSTAEATDQWFYDGDLEIEHRRGVQLQASWFHGAGGELAAMKEETDLNSNLALDTYYYHGDDLQNVMAVTDASGSLVEQYEYADWGRPRIFNGAGSSIPTSAISNPFLFRSFRLDPESRLYTAPGGQLDPRAGRVVNGPPNSLMNWSINGGFNLTNPWSPTASPDDGTAATETIVFRPHRGMVK